MIKNIKNYMDFIKEEYAEKEYSTSRYNEEELIETKKEFVELCEKIEKQFGFNIEEIVFDNIHNQFTVRIKTYQLMVDDLSHRPIIYDEFITEEKAKQAGEIIDKGTIDCIRKWEHKFFIRENHKILTHNEIKNILKINK